MLSGGALMAMPRLELTIFGGISESVKVRAKFVVPVKVPVGVPEITPVLEFKLNPWGSGWEFQV